MREPIRWTTVPAAAVLALLSACSSAPTTDASSTGADGAHAATGSVTEVTTAGFEDHDDDADHEWDPATEVAVTLEGDTATAGAAGVTIEGSTVTLTAAGTYHLTGTLTDGQVVVETADDGIVRLVLDGVEITSSTTSAVSVTRAERVVVVLADGSTNALTDAETYTYPDASTDEPNATLFSTADLTVTGDGALTVEGRSNDGIASKDGLVIASGTITVDAVDDGIRGKDYLVVKGGALDVTAGGDGLKADNEEDADLGLIAISAGTVRVTAGVDGVDAVTSVLIAGGALTVDAGDDGVHSDAALTITDGTVEVDAYEGLEGTAISISGGEITVTARDDGINVAGGNDGSGAQGPPGQEQLAASGDDRNLTITGGIVVLDAEGDGLDSNGSITMSGGTVVVNGPTGDGNGAIDVDLGFEISGGVLVAAGSAGMAEMPDETSSQAVLGFRLGSASAGTVLHVVDQGGTVVASFVASKDFASFVLSTPVLVGGETYEIYLGGSADTGADSVGGLAAQGDLTGAAHLGSAAASAG